VNFAGDTQVDDKPKVQTADKTKIDDKTTRTALQICFLSVRQDRFLAHGTGVKVG
jgi:hypothetical protein